MRLKKRYLCTALSLAFTQQAVAAQESHNADRMVQSGIIDDDHRSRSTHHEGPG